MLKPVGKGCGFTRVKFKAIGCLSEAWLRAGHSTVCLKQPADLWLLAVCVRV